MKKQMLESLIGDLINELIDYGYPVNGIIHILKLYGFDEETIKDYYGLEVETNESTKN